MKMLFIFPKYISCKCSLFGAEYTKKSISTKILRNICIIPGNNRQASRKKSTYNRYYKEQICTRKEERTYGI